LSKKVKTARLSIFSNLVLIVIKLVAGLLSGSISIISEAIHSALDLVAAVIAYFAVKISGNPPDRNHPYGHGKVENVSGVIEALLILLAATWIIYEGVDKFLHHEPVAYFGLGITVMMISAIVNFFVSRRLYKVAKETDSIALEADALHLKTDVYTSLGVALGLLLIYITKIQVLDPIIAIVVALFIIREAFELLKRSFTPLLDSKLPDEDIRAIQEIIQTHSKGCTSFHKFRTRKSGSSKYIDFHLEVPENISVKEAHEICDEIEAEIKNKLGSVDINIHIEPCKGKRK